MNDSTCRKKHKKKEQIAPFSKLITNAFPYYFSGNSFPGNSSNTILL